LATQHISVNKFVIAFWFLLLFQQQQIHRQCYRNSNFPTPYSQSLLRGLIALKWSEERQRQGHHKVLRNKTNDRPFLSTYVTPPPPHCTNHLMIIKHCCSTHTRDKSEMKEKNTRRKRCCVSASPHTPFGSPVDQGINSAARCFYPQSEKIASGTAAHLQRFTFVGYAIE
jgi:hypothetical protein